MAISYSADNDKRFRQALERARNVTDDLRIPLGLIAKDFYKSQAAIWKLKSPGQYPDLAESTKKDRERRGQPLYPILRRTGALETAASIQGGLGNVTRLIGKSQMHLGVEGSVIPYAIYHQSNRARSKIPLRKFIFIGPEAPQFATSEQVGRLQRWLGILNGYIAQKMEQQGFQLKGGK